eukprot:359090-Chlamydomonas_euryale.AAC.1
MGELYGEYNLLTNEWTDGLGSTLIRNAVADTAPDKKWVVFDGPVDAIWIENMNTVLDDNCTLCLPNGERIKLNPTTMRMLFEVQDLAVASPATKCGGETEQTRMLFEEQDLTVASPATVRMGKRAGVTRGLGCGDQRAKIAQQIRMLTEVQKNGGGVACDGAIDKMAVASPVMVR